MKKQTWQILGTLVGVGVIGGAGIFGIQAIDANRATLEPTAEPTSVVSVYETNGFAEAPEKVAPAPAPVVEAAPAPVEPAPVEEPVYDEPAAPDYGTPVPWIADPDPNNAEGGYWDTSACPSGAGYQAPDGNQYCA